MVMKTAGKRAGSRIVNWVDNMVDLMNDCWTGKLSGVMACLRAGCVIVEAVD